MLKGKIWLLWILAGAAAAGAWIFLQPSQKPQLKILTYSSFASLYGPGALLRKEFEKTCHCRISWIKGEDSTGLVQRLSLDLDIDLVVGLDQLSLPESMASWRAIPFDNSLLTKEAQRFTDFFSKGKAQNSEDPDGMRENSPLSKDNLAKALRSGKINLSALPPLGEKTKREKETRLPKEPKKINSLPDFPKKTDEAIYFVPVDWAPIGWIFKGRAGEKLKSLPDLLNLPGKISFPGPQTSSLGLQFYYWIYDYYSGDKLKIQRFLQKLRRKTYSSPPSWSLSYGFFKKGHADFSLSYLTSPLYHVLEEGDKSYHFAYFESGHPYQAEFAGIPKSSLHPELAERFLRFLLSAKAQKQIMQSHYMLPAAKGVQEGVFKNLPLPRRISYRKMKDFQKDKKEWIRLWRKSFH